jgi:undecaprenyl diphosphate synthase
MFGLRKNKNNDPFKGVRHIALSLNGIEKWAKDHDKGFEEAWRESFLAINEMISFQVKMDIPILSFNVMPMELKERNNFSLIVDSLVEFFNYLLSSECIKKNQIKISVLGKWYDMPGRLVESIKKITAETKDYDNFFVNFCINYDGQEELIDSFRIIARKIRSSILDPDSITKEEVKDNLYSSYFIPPDLIIITGKRKFFGGFLLWDSIKSKIYFSDKLWPDIKIDDLNVIIQKIFK